MSHSKTDLTLSVVNQSIDITLLFSESELLTSYLLLLYILKERPDTIYVMEDSQVSNNVMNVLNIRVLH